jgi:carbon storage regulator CsrA
MLILSRREGEKIVFPALGIVLELQKIKGSTARLGIKAPAEIKILRDELAPDAVGAPHAPPQQRKLSHAARNHLHTALLALQLSRRQLERGMTLEAEASFARGLAALEQLEAEAEAARPASPKPAAVSPRCRALLVEDDPNQSELLAGFLRMNGFDVATSDDGARALDYLASHAQPDMVLLDMFMPRCDGPTTVSAIRSNPAFAGIKVFAISGTSPSELGVSTGPSGVNRWFAKPVNPEKLVQELVREVELPPHVGVAAGR